MSDRVGSEHGWVVVDAVAYEAGGAILLALDGPPTAPSGKVTMAYEHGIAGPLHLLRPDNLYESSCGRVANWVIPFRAPTPLPTFCEGCLDGYVGRMSPPWSAERQGGKASPS